MEDTSLALVKEDPNFQRLATLSPFREHIIHLAAEDVAKDLDKPTSKVLNALSKDSVLRARVYYDGVSIGLQLSEGNAHAAVQLLWDLLASGDWVDALAYLPINVDAPREFIRVVVLEVMKRDTTTATMWADTFMLMHDYLYSAIYANALGLKEGDIPEDPHEALLTMFGRYKQIASPCLHRMNQYEKLGLSPIAATWENLSRRLEDWSKLSQGQIVDRIRANAFDPLHPRGEELPMSRAYLALRDVRRMLDLAHNKDLSQRQVYNKARESEPEIRPLIFRREWMFGLDAMQLAALRSLGWILMEGEEDTQMYEVQIKLELWPVCPECQDRLAIYPGEPEPFWCLECVHGYVEGQELQEELWYWRKADPESGFDDDWLAIAGLKKEPKGALVETHTVGPLTAVVYSVLVPWAQIHQWKEDTLMPVDGDTSMVGKRYHHLDYPSMIIEVVEEVSATRVKGYIVEPGECKLEQYQATNDRDAPVKYIIYPFSVAKLRSPPDGD